MAVLDRSELQSSPLADLHAIADQLGIDGFRLLRKGELIDAIIAGQSDGVRSLQAEPGGRSRSRMGRFIRSRRKAAAPDEDSGERPQPEQPSSQALPPEQQVGAPGQQVGAPGQQVGAPGQQVGAPGPRVEQGGSAISSVPATVSSTPRRRPGRRERQKRLAEGRVAEGRLAEGRVAEGRVAERRVADGVIELLGNGSAFLRVDPPEPSDEDVYISAAQARRFELASGDRVRGPVRARRRSERYPSLVRIEEINGAPADSLTEGTRFEDLPAAYPSERLELQSEDPTLEAIERLTPLGYGSRAVIVGAARAGKTEVLRRIAGALAGREDLLVTLALSGVRPEEIAEWRKGPLAPAVALTFAASADAQGRAVEGVLESAKRATARGAHALLLIDSLDGLHPHCARKVLAAARNLSEGGSLTVIATASRPFGGETTVIALDARHTTTGRLPALDLPGSGTLRPELLVGDDGAEAITRARAAVVEES